MSSPFEDGSDSGPLSDVLVIVPAFNEVSVIGRVVGALRAEFDKVLVVDDGSTDQTAEVARMAGSHVARHAINLGQGAALATGIRVATRLPAVNWIVTFDADGQHQVTDAVRLVEHARSGGYDVVLGTRFGGGRPEMPTRKRWLLRAATAYTRWSTGLAVTDTHNGLRVFRRDFAARLNLKETGMGHASEILDRIAELSANWGELPVDIRYTEYSKANGQPMSNSVNIMFDRMLGRGHG